MNGFCILESYPSKHTTRGSAHRRYRAILKRNVIPSKRVLARSRTRDNTAYFTWHTSGLYPVRPGAKIQGWQEDWVRGCRAKEPSVLPKRRFARTAYRRGLNPATGRVLSYCLLLPCECWSLHWASLCSFAINISRYVRWPHFRSNFLTMTLLCIH